MDNAVAEVRMACGRYYLTVNGVIVAMEGDPCRDYQFPDNGWNHGNLTEAARIINGDPKPKKIAPGP